MPTQDNLSDHLLAEVIALIRNDQEAWRQIKEFELWIEKDYANAAQQGMDPGNPDYEGERYVGKDFVAIINPYMERNFGQRYNYSLATVIMAVRREIRLELGLPV